jgi:hypothetical protein
MTDEKNPLSIISDRFPPNWHRSIDVMSGWNDLVLQVHNDIMAIDPDYVPVQVKEKFGGLRYYIHYSPQWTKEQYNAVVEIIAFAEQKSFTICEVCGEPGKLRDGRVAPKSKRTHRILTLCDIHMDADPWDYSDISFTEMLQNAIDKNKES